MKSTVLFAPDVPTTQSGAARIWVLAMASALQSLGHEVLVHPRNRNVPELAKRLAELGVTVLPYDASSPEEEDAHGQVPHFRARKIIALARTKRADHVLAQGTDLVRFLAGSGRLADSLWALPLDAPFRSDTLTAQLIGQLPKMSPGVHRFLVATESQRAVLEATDPSMTSRVQLLPTLDDSIGRLPQTAADGVEKSHLRAAYDASLPLDIEIDLSLFSEFSTPDLNDYIKAASRKRTVPRVYISGTTVSPVADDPIWACMPGRQLGDIGRRRGARLGLMPFPVDPVASKFAHAYYSYEGLIPVDVSGATGSTNDGVLRLASSAQLLEPLDPSSRAGLSMASGPAQAATSPQGTGLPRPAEPVRVERQLRVVIAGADFKFAGDLISSLASRPEIDLRIDVFEHNSTPQPEISQQYVDWADVVIAEFASYNALWYADNCRPGQKLIVHLHGYELLSPWIDELNVDNCDAIVVPSEFYRQRAMSLKGWADDLLTVIPNSISVEDLRREKFEDARFHLGLAGYVPVLKRPDRALDLLRLLREEDERYVLHLRGHSPWNYSWEWRKTAHQDSYRAFFNNAGSDPAILRGLCFEEFAPDMGNWLRKIGWILSPSFRETFHLAGVEGAASGAVPVVWVREGSREIFTDRWNFPSTEHIADFILATNRSAEDFTAEGARAMAFSERYSAQTTGTAWRELITSLVSRKGITVHHDAPDLDTAAGRAAAVAQQIAAPEQRTLLESTQDALLRHSYEEAVDVLDAGIGITAHAKGPLKMAELWVRGVAALDAQRHALFAPQVGRPVGTMQCPLTVRRQGDTSSTLAREGLELVTADLVPYGFSDPLEAPPSISRDDVQGDRAATLLELPGPIRADRWALSLAVQVTNLVVDTAADGVVVRGPWWTALIAGLAASSLGLPFCWVVSDPLDAQRALEAHESPFTADQAAQLAHTVLRQASIVVDETGVLTQTGLTAMLPLASRFTEAPHGPEALEAPGYIGIPEAVPTPLPELRALIAGTDRFIESWRSTGIDLTQLTPESVRDPVPPSIDLVILDGHLINDPAWAPLMVGKNEGSATVVSQLFDRARVSNARSLLFAHTQAARLESAIGTARKADVLSLSDRELSQRVLSLNPLSVTRVVTLEEGDTPWERKPAAFLRSIGMAVPPSAPDRSDATPGLRFPESTRARSPRNMGPSEEPAPAVEGISVIMATHRGAERISGMLDSLGSQSLPTQLIELIVVENGADPEVIDAVDRFASVSGIDTHYIYRSEPGAGPARNEGLTHVSREYVTFVDDDDALEKNFLLSMWLTASPDTVVLGTLTDVHPDGTHDTNTATTRRVATLEGGRLPLSRRAGSLGLNACKLIPTPVATSMRYPDTLHSGEDVVFMSQLLGRGLFFAPAAPMEHSAYLRGMRQNSISRRELSFDFNVAQRIGVIRALEAQKNNVNTKSDISALTHLQKAQLGFIRKYRDAHPQDNQRVNQAIISAKVAHIVPVLDG